ncbi:phytanoyl-CoA dioxygenase family protein [Sphingomonas sp. MMS24-J45]|uniref:phytanoyl-CoA dioxygenase family protein n=1 Tax=Sphingomonas sp. MMS24-J45 TaxID=3238806 RepID=UPI00384FFDC5
MSHALSHIRGIEAYLDRLTGRSQERLPEHQWRMLLDTLGLGIEQTMQHAGRTRPDFATFAEWVISTAGHPDPERVARYHAALDGLPPPPTTAARLAEIDAMPPVLDADDLSHWNELGYVILRAAIDPALAADTAALVWEIVGATPDNPASWYDAGARNGIMVQHFQSPQQDAIRRSPRTHKAFAQLWGRSDLWMNTDRLGFNPPVRHDWKFAGQPLHWDDSLVRPIPFGTQAILYLTDTAAEQGALQLIPGFHHKLDAWLDSLGDSDPRLVDLTAQAVPIAANAGDLIIWRSDLPHGATANHGRVPRLVQYLAMYPPTPIAPRDWL